MFDSYKSVLYHFITTDNHPCKQVSHPERTYGEPKSVGSHCRGKNHFATSPPPAES